MLSGIALLHDSSCFATHCNCNKEAPAVFWMGSVGLPPYILDVAPSDFNFFPPMKLCLGGQHFATDDELQTSVENWLKAQAAGFYDESIGKFVPR